MTPEQWVMSGDTGVSSMTIWAVLMNAVPERHNGRTRFDVPHDDGDFGRCYRLLTLVPGFRKRLPEVAARFPIWGPFVRDWELLEQLYEGDGEDHEALYRRIRALVDEGRLAAGLKRVGRSGWETPGGGTVATLGRVELQTNGE